MSVNAAGTGDGNDSSVGGEGPQWLSGEGRYAVFVSFATDLVSPSTPQERHRPCLRPGHGRRYDRADHEGFAGDHANGISGSAAISRDGRWAVFSSGASNLVPGDTNFEVDTFVYDRQTQVLERISVTSAEEEQNRNSVGPVSISDDGNLFGAPSDSSGW